VKEKEKIENRLRKDVAFSCRLRNVSTKIFPPNLVYNAGLRLLVCEVIIVFCVVLKYYN
jgi:hypothetical protein